MKVENSIPQLVSDLSGLVAKEIERAGTTTGHEDIDLGKLTKMMSDLVQMKLKAESLVLDDLGDMTNVDKIGIFCDEFVSQLKFSELQELNKRISTECKRQKKVRKEQATKLATANATS